MRSLLPLLLAIFGSAIAGNVGPIPFMTCNDNGNQRKNGEEWITATGFVKKCISSEFYAQTKITACVSDKGAKVPVGSSVVEGNFKFYCKDNGKGGVSKSYDPIGAPASGTPVGKCPDGSGFRSNGEEWTTSNGFVKKCSAPSGGGYQTTVTACVSYKQTRVPVGSSINEDGMKFSCTKLPNGSVTKSTTPIL